MIFPVYEPWNDSCFSAIILRLPSGQAEILFCCSRSFGGVRKLKGNRVMKNKISALTRQIASELDDLSLRIYNSPELGYKEFKASSWHMELLNKYGFNIQERLCGLETGFKAIYDSGKNGLTVAFMAEYDALPGIGHGCGHNILGAASTGAGIILRSIADEIGGRVIVFGTPAEETSGAKVTFAEEGEFDGVDIAMIAHPASWYARSGSSLALMPLQFEFYGKPAHASSVPWEGINALDAAICTINAINALREHMRPDSRVHGVVIDGGKAANIVPEYSKVQYYVRSTAKSYNETLAERIKDCARAGALATGCRLEITQFEFSYDNLITNQALSRTFCAAMCDIAGIELDKPRENVGSSDVGQVSHICPTIHPYFDITNDRNVAGHSRELAEATLTDYAKEQMRNTVAALSLTAYRVMTDPALYAEIYEEFLHTPK